MKGHEHKLARMEDILNLPVRDPRHAEFSAAHIKWVKVEGGRQGGDDIALIPFARVGDFVKGECSSAECPASFRVESRRKIHEGSINKPRFDGYLEYTLPSKWRCSHAWGFEVMLFGMARVKTRCTVEALPHGRDKELAIISEVEMLFGVVGVYSL
ncbi:hypothetical protein ACFX2I_016974 [Malus domestica]